MTLAPSGGWGDVPSATRVVLLPSGTDEPHMPPRLVIDAADVDTEAELHLSPWKVNGLALDVQRSASTKRRRVDRGSALWYNTGRENAVRSAQEATVSIAIREARPGDEAAIVELIAELAESAGESSPVTQEYVTRYLRSPGNHVLLAEEQGQVVGLLSYSVRPNLYHAADSGLIEELVVRDPYRGRGVGSALLTALLARLTALGCAEVSVTTMPDNERAQQFYRSHGMVDEAVFLEKHLGKGER